MEAALEAEAPCPVEAARSDAGLLRLVGEAAADWRA